MPQVAYIVARKSKKKDITDIMLLWCLLVLTLELIYKHKNLGVKASNDPKAYSYSIKKIDEYLGYISWTEIYTYSEDAIKIADAKDLLWELIAKDPCRPEAYCKLWKIYTAEKKYDRCLEICERLFLEGSEFDDNEYV